MDKSTRNIVLQKLVKQNVIKEEALEIVSFKIPVKEALCIKKNTILNEKKKLNHMASKIINALLLKNNCHFGEKGRIIKNIIENEELLQDDEQDNDDKQSNDEEKDKDIEENDNNDENIQNIKNVEDNETIENVEDQQEELKNEEIIREKSKIQSTQFTKIIKSVDILRKVILLQNSLLLNNNTTDRFHNEINNLSGLEYRTIMKEVNEFGTNTSIIKDINQDTNKRKNNPLKTSTQSNISNKIFSIPTINPIILTKLNIAVPNKNQHLIQLQKTIKSKYKKIEVDNSLSSLCFKRKKQIDLNSSSFSKTSYNADINKKINTINKCFTSFKNKIPIGQNPYLQMKGEIKVIKDFYFKIRREPISFNKTNKISSQFFIKTAHKISKFSQRTRFKKIAEPEFKKIEPPQSYTIETTEPNTLTLEPFNMKDKNVFVMSGQDIIKNPFNKITTNGDTGMIVIKKRMVISKKDMLKKYEKSILKDESILNDNEIDLNDPKNKILISKVENHRKPINFKEVIIIKDHISFNKQIILSHKKELSLKANIIISLFRKFYRSIKGITTSSENVLSVHREKKVLIKKKEIVKCQNNFDQQILNNQLIVSNKIRYDSELIYKASSTFKKSNSLKNVYIRYATKIQRAYEKFKLIKANKEVNIVKKKNFIIKQEFDENLVIDDEDINVELHENEREKGFNVNSALNKAKFRKIFRRPYLKYLNLKALKITKFLRASAKKLKIKKLICNLESLRLSKEKFFSKWKDISLKYSNAQSFCTFLNKVNISKNLLKIKPIIQRQKSVLSIFKNMLLKHNGKKGLLKLYFDRLKIKISKISLTTKFFNSFLNIYKKYKVKSVIRQITLKANSNYKFSKIDKLEKICSNLKSKQKFYNFITNLFFKISLPCGSTQMITKKYNHIVNQTESLISYTNFNSIKPFSNRYLHLVYVISKLNGFKKLDDTSKNHDKEELVNLTKIAFENIKEIAYLNQFLKLTNRVNFRSFNLKAIVNVSSEDLKRQLNYYYSVKRIHNTIALPFFKSFIRVCRIAMSKILF